MSVIDYPDGRDYYIAVQHPPTAFMPPSLQRATFERDSWGGPLMAQGRSAVVFHATVDGVDTAVRCYTRGHASSADRYDGLNSYVSAHGLGAYIGSVTWHNDAIRVKGALRPVLTTEWIDGRILDQYVGYLAENGNADALTAIADLWRTLVGTLQRADFAHGDLQHANVIVDERKQLRLIDFDGVWIPQFADQDAPAEFGHENYQHPGRTARTGWGSLSDTFSALVIYLSLVALGKDPGLWLPLYDGNNLLFTSQDFVAPFETDVWKQLDRIGDPEVNRLAGKLRECCAADWKPTSGLEGLLTVNWWEEDTTTLATAESPPTTPLAPPGWRTWIMPELPSSSYQAEVEVSVPLKQAQGHQWTGLPATSGAQARPARQAGTADWWERLPRAESELPTTPAARPAVAIGAFSLVLGLVLLIVGGVADAAVVLVVGGVLGLIGVTLLISGRAERIRR